MHIFNTLFAIALAASAVALCPSAHDDASRDLLQGAKSVLGGNWVPDMNSTLPSPNLYPHQWSWDAAFIAMGYSHYDTGKAIDETNALFRGQWKNGLLPHIVFNPSADESYFPGPSFWQIETSQNAPDGVATSGIIQPPVHAIASLSIYKNARTEEMKALALEHLRTIYPKLALWHEYLYNERDPFNEGLVFIRHMWESGMDNSPAWDDALDAIKLTPDMIPEYTRVDKGKVGHVEERPTSFFYDRAVYLIKIFQENSYDESAIWQNSPFLIQDVLFNSILARAGTALGEIADILGFSEDARLNFARSERTASAITSKLYDPAAKFYFDYDMVAKKLIRTKISGGFVALFGARMDTTHLDAMIEHLYAPEFLGEDLTSWTIPSVAKNDPGYTNTTYWKGPAWLNINYLVRDGLVRNGKGNVHAERISSYLKERSIEMVNKVGFFEYFNPISGSPHGGHHFSWSAALVIDWVCTSDSESVKMPSSSSSWSDAGNVLYAAILATVTAIAATAFKLISNEAAKRKADAKVQELLQAARKKSSREDTVHISVGRRLHPRTHHGGVIRRST